MITLLLEWQHSLWLLLAVIVEIMANVLLKLSDGFKKKGYGLLSLIAVLVAFSALGQAVKGIDLAVAYALWGGLGLLATIGFGWILFGQRLNWIGGLGIVLLLLGMAIIKLT